MKIRKEKSHKSEVTKQKPQWDTRKIVLYDPPAMTQEDIESMNRLFAQAGNDVAGIAAAAGVKPKKIVKVRARRGRIGSQRQGLETIGRLLKEICALEGREEVIARTGVAAGYANAMKQYALLSDNELEEIIELLNQAGEDRLERIDKKNIASIFKELIEKSKASKAWTRYVNVVEKQV
ncbi:MAG: hypothetical protein HDQ99_14725 [Lachnospiraceae bacterium]|nr:hypothetical protein [Lachnospiraceae bacterium]